MYGIVSILFVYVVYLMLGFCSVPAAKPKSRERGTCCVGNRHQGLQLVRHDLEMLLTARDDTTSLQYQRC